MPHLPIYDDITYFIAHPEWGSQSAWENGQIRYGDQCAAIGYAFGLESFSEVCSLLGFRDNGIGLEPLIGAKGQMLKLIANRKRYPKSVVEIGGGRGEISVGLSFCEDIGIQMIEPSKAVNSLIAVTKERYGIERYFPIINEALMDCFYKVAWSKVDTVIICETLEHLEQWEFQIAFDHFRPFLINNKGYLIITNWIDAWPLPVILPHHCWEINDKTYDWIAEEGKTIYRENSHLVVQFGGS